MGRMERGWPRRAARLGGVWFSCALMAAAAVASDDDVPQFNRDIRPLFSDRCYLCHGPDVSSREAGFRLDQRESATAAADSGDTPIVPGDVEASEILERLRSDDPDYRMPPPDAHKPALTEAEIDAVARWIEAGAEYQPHWSLIPPRRPPLPQPPGSEWCRNAIDRFVLDRLAARGMSPSPPADRVTLLRRLSLDLTGLPPTPEEVQAFLDDASPEAVERVVDRLLASPHFGEHRARYWLDVVRYGDTHGLHLDNYREMWPYRDWVIRAFNDNLPWDQFTIRQLAGDLLPDPQLEDLVASGYNRLHVTTNEGGSINEEVEVRNVVDRVNTTGTVFLGLTVGCAQCHDHKFDPISAAEYFSLYAFFNNLDAAAMDGNIKDPAPTVRVPSAEQRDQLAELESELASLRSRLEAADPELDRQQADWEAAWRDRQAEMWRPLRPEGLAAAHGSQLTLDEGGIVTVGGANPDQEVIEFTAAVPPGRWVALRLEALLAEGDEAAEGIGRAANGNAVLTEFEAEGLGGEGDPPLKLAQALADYSQPEFPVAAAVDGRVDATSGWAVEGHRRREPRVAVFVLDRPRELAAEGAIRIRLRFESQYQQHVFRRMRFSITEEGGLWPVAQSDWHLLGPFAQPDGQVAFQTEYGPETKVALGEPVGAEERVWTRRPDLVDGSVHRLGTEQAAWYLHRRIDSPDERPLVLSIGSDDAVRVWLNGQSIHMNNLSRGVQPDQDRVTGTLRAGGNDLVVKIVNFGGESGFSYRLVDDESPRPSLALLRRLEGSAEARTAEEAAEVRDYFRRWHWPGYAELAEQRDRAEEARQQLEASLPTTLISRERGEVQPAYVLKRGEYDKPDRERGARPRQVPAALPPLDPSLPANRLGFALWLVSPEQPLMSRVTVNRLWAQCFGSGLVKTAEDFGAQGSWPTHPELLDWLAVEFRESGWDVKRLVKLIVMSATYQQSSRLTAERLAADPRNEWLGRGPRFRLDAETIRDQALAAAGLLVDRLGGPSVKPPQPAGLWEAVGYVGSNTQNFQADAGTDKVYRRSVYTFWKRTAAPPQMAIFDAPTREECTARRERTNTPLQALLMMNEQQVIEAALQLAAGAMAARDDDAGRATEIFRRVVARLPEAEELAELLQLYEAQRAAYGQQPELAAALVRQAPPPPAPRGDLPADEWAAWSLVANVVLNLDEALTKE